MEVINRVSQGSVLEPDLCNIFLKDLEMAVSESADSTVLFREI